MRTEVPRLSLNNLDHKLHRQADRRNARGGGADGRKNDLIKTSQAALNGGSRSPAAPALPRVLFLDEPTLGLDPQTRNTIWEFINTSEREKITRVHDHPLHGRRRRTATASPSSDHGKIIAEGTPAKLKEMVHEIYPARDRGQRAAIAEIREAFGIPAKEENGGLFLEVERGEEFIPGSSIGLSSGPARV